jgi:hypothetical protein
VADAIDQDALGSGLSALASCPRCDALQLRSPWPRLLRPRLSEQLGREHSEGAGDLDQRPDRQILSTAFDALEVLEREAEAFRLLFLGEPGLGTQLGHTSSDVLDCVVDVVRAHTSDAVTRRACITPTLRLVLSRGMRRAGATGLFSSHRPGNMEDKERSHVHQIP